MVASDDPIAGCVCGGLGLLVVRYQDGTDPDLGVCRCVKGQHLRRGWPAAVAMLARRYELHEDQVHLIEALADDAAELARWGVPRGPAAAVTEDFVHAGQVRPKARR